MENIEVEGGISPIQYWIKIINYILLDYYERDQIQLKYDRMDLFRGYPDLCQFFKVKYCHNT